jgi:hypothetical protein
MEASSEGDHRWQDTVSEHKTRFVKILDRDTQLKTC